MKQEYFEIGQIVNTFGIKGIVKVNAYTDDPLEFANLKTILIEKNKKLLEFEIEEAKLLLSGTRMSIQDISDELSFGSRSFFFSSFQKETGMSPTAYRGEHCKG